MRGLKYLTCSDRNRDAMVGRRHALADIFKLFQRLVDAVAVGVSDTAIAPDKRA